MNDAEQLMKEHATLIGEVTMNWNDVHGLVFQTFKLMSGLSQEMADAVFYSLRSDAGQRDLTIAVAKVALASEPERLAAFKKIMNKIGTLAAVRNEAIHSEWGVDILIDDATGEATTGGISKIRGHDDGQFTARFEALKPQLSAAFSELWNWMAPMPPPSSPRTAP